MTYSMTGFGQGSVDVRDWTIIVEAKTLNQRCLDFHLSMPQMSGNVEMLLQKLVKQHIGRGRLDLLVTVKQKAGKGNIEGFNRDLFDERVAFINELFEGSWSKSKVREFVLGMPDIWSGVKSFPADSEEIIVGIMDAAQIALDRVNETRLIEGKELRKVMLEAIDELEVSRDAALARAPERIVEYKKRMDERLQEIAKDVDLVADPQRLAFEVALLVDKLDVAEEFARIGAHISALRILLMTTDNALTCVGKKVDFYLQELNREITTLASKSRDTMITKHTIDMRTQIESMREQAANIQ